MGPNLDEMKRIDTEQQVRPMHPTPLYIFFLFSMIMQICAFVLTREYSCWSTYPVATAVGFYLLSILGMTITGVLVVCFTAAKRTSKSFLQFPSIQ